MKGERIVVHQGGVRRTVDGEGFVVVLSYCALRQHDGATFAFSDVFCGLEPSEATTGENAEALLAPLGTQPTETFDSL